MTSNGDWSDYVANPTEIDVRLAEIKRRYSAATGRPVNSPEEAEKAFDWFHLWGGGEPAVDKKHYSDDPSYEPIYTGYFGAPEESKQQMYRRMMELVQSRQQARQRPSV